MSKRFQRATRTGVRLTERDLQIVWAVWEARYLTTQLVARLLFSPTTYSGCKERLRRLYDLRYLEKRRAQVNDPDIYYLGLYGRRHIASLGEWDQGTVDRAAGVAGGQAAGPSSLLMMDHDLTLAKLYVNARLECAGYGWAMRWRNTRLLELDKLGVQPDAWLEVGHGESNRAAYLEFTAAMPEEKELRGKIAGYEALWERAGTPTPVLWLTTTRHKRQALREATQKSGYRDCFLVGSIEDAGEMLTGEIWWWSEAPEGMVQWIKPSR